MLRVAAPRRLVGGDLPQPGPWCTRLHIAPLSNQLSDKTRNSHSDRLNSDPTSQSVIVIHSKQQEQDSLSSRFTLLDHIS
ncbi:hypothetical protein PCANC_24877 [Puccinia coronata f. sp. avenae]|uniref:Uncharacterized protein n=1 Tax=Puccinia coronata f. sp. avenae TaxID=200324 RepID=A0A2N5TKL5_9BASI|nr:hypothetical protein PCANC_24877 [Puccinia coronata f. sp. avenae]PLW36123.1 hypothetical protein PCASD_11658 [Puccinia coronata f. sp. avenae]